MNRALRPWERASVLKRIWDGSRAIPYATRIFLDRIDTIHRMIPLFARV